MKNLFGKEHGGRTYIHGTVSFGTRLDGVLLGLGLDGRTGCAAVVQHMTDGLHIAVKLKEQGKLLCLGDVGLLHQHTLVVQLFPQDFGAEPLRDEVTVFLLR